ncbi:MAG TPA: MoaD/ThiS family protein [Candidatus Baltobacteraceae bacterium]|nr:MoaD/ThiS family protein [Candidatus Baltobacteraceae bacterium]
MYIPTPLRTLTDNRGELAIEAGTVRELIDHLETTYRGMQGRLRDEQGAVRHFVNVYVNDEDIRFLQGPDTPLKPGDQVAIVPAVAGGR